MLRVRLIHVHQDDLARQLRRTFRAGQQLPQVPGPSVGDHQNRKTPLLHFFPFQSRYSCHKHSRFQHHTSFSIRRDPTRLSARRIV